MAAAAHDPAATATAPRGEAGAIVDTERQDVVYAGWIELPENLRGGQQDEVQPGAGSLVRGGAGPRQGLQGG